WSCTPTAPAGRHLGEQAATSAVPYAGGVSPCVPHRRYTTANPGQSGCSNRDTRSTVDVRSCADPGHTVTRDSTAGASSNEKYTFPIDTTSRPAMSRTSSCEPSQNTPFPSAGENVTDSPNTGPFPPSPSYGSTCTV